MSEQAMKKQEARCRFHERRELETNEHDFAFLDGFDAGYEAGKNDGIPQGALDGYDAGLIAGQPQWVSVSERLPGFNAWYLISYGAYVHEAYFWTATKDWSYNRPPESDRREVIEPPVAWMPLPKPYTPGGKCYPTALDAFRELQEADQ
jgi:hypothetical protein